MHHLHHKRLSSPPPSYVYSPPQMSPPLLLPPNSFLHASSPSQAFVLPPSPSTSCVYSLHHKRLISPPLPSVASLYVLYPLQLFVLSSLPSLLLILLSFFAPKRFVFPFILLPPLPLHPSHMHRFHHTHLICAPCRTATHTYPFLVVHSTLRLVCVCAK